MQSSRDQVLHKFTLLQTLTWRATYNMQSSRGSAASDAERGFTRSNSRRLFHLTLRVLSRDNLRGDSLVTTDRSFLSVRQLLLWFVITTIGDDAVTEPPHPHPHPTPINGQKSRATMLKKLKQRLNQSDGFNLAEAFDSCTEVGLVRSRIFRIWSQPTPRRHTFPSMTILACPDLNPIGGRGQRT
ncbi:hypothetical protein RRG08_051611 [Elysia crispata]|uniref:Uncharacterized protein n=1 Tax=Elysia crispata TaxID=231223 RepID=A0AAE1DSL4_9GAST|nr:hypothetical protein RRG08_051611 [Elysia crispata]